MDAKEMIDEIEKPKRRWIAYKDEPASKEVEKPTGDCDHFVGTYDRTDLEKASYLEAYMNRTGLNTAKRYTPEECLDVVFKYCPECGEKLE